MKRSIMQEIKYIDKLEEMVDEGNHCLRLSLERNKQFFTQKKSK